MNTIILYHYKMNYVDFCKKFGVKLKYYRLIKNLTQENLAEQLDVDSHYVSDIECGRRNITFKTVYKIASTLDIEVYKLFQFD